MQEAVIVKLRRWGNSLGLIVPAQSVREHGLREGDLVDVELKGQASTLENLSGTLHLRTDLDRLMREVKEGWDDL